MLADDVSVGRQVTVGDFSTSILLKIAETTAADDISGWNVFDFIIEDKLDTVDVEKDPRRLIRINAGTVEFFYSRIGSGNGGDIA